MGSSSDEANIGKMITIQGRLILNSIATYFGLIDSNILTESVNENNALISYVIALVILNVGYWYCMKNVPYEAVKQWIMEVYGPFNSFLVLIVVRLIDHIIFDGSGNSMINMLAEPVIVITVVAMIIVVTERRLQSEPSKDK
jgi:hypothetical protein